MPETANNPPSIIWPVHAPNPSCSVISNTLLLSTSSGPGSPTEGSFVRKNLGGDAEAAHSATETETADSDAGRENTGGDGKEVEVKFDRLPIASGVKDCCACARCVCRRNRRAKGSMTSHKVVVAKCS